MGEPASHITFVGLGGVSLSSVSRQDKQSRLSDQSGNQPYQEDFTAVKQYLLEYGLPMKQLKLLVYWKQDQYEITEYCEGL